MVKLPAGNAVLSKDEDGDEDSNVDMDMLVALVSGIVMGSDQRRALARRRLFVGWMASRRSPRSKQRSERHQR